MTQSAETAKVRNPARRARPAWQAETRASATRAILDGARQIYSSEGARRLTVRRLADRLGCSPAAIYRYFPGKTAILQALSQEGFRLLTSGVRAARSDDPLLVLRAVYWRCYEFSKLNPGYFALMFLDRVPLGTGAANADPARLIITEGARAVRTCAEAGLLPSRIRADEAARVLWATALGPALLAQPGNSAPDADVDVVAAIALDTAIAGLRAGGGQRLQVGSEPSVSGGVFGLGGDAEEGGGSS